MLCYATMRYLFWLVQYHMIQYVQEQQAAICGSSCKYWTIRFLLPETEEWNIIEDLLNVLKPFCDGTAIKSSSSYPTFFTFSIIIT